MRDSRKAELRKHVEAVQAALRPIGQSDNGVDGVSEDQPTPHQYGAHHHDEYVDEERFTTVTVEPIDFDESSLDGFEDQVRDVNAEKSMAGEQRKPKKADAKEKRKKFTYLSKGEMKKTRQKIKVTKLQKYSKAKKTRESKSSTNKGKRKLKRS